MFYSNISVKSINHDLGFNLKLIRQKRNLTQKQLADELFTTQCRISAIEQGSGALSAWELIYLIYFLGIDFNEIDPLAKSTVWNKPDLRLDATPASKVKNI